MRAPALLALLLAAPPAFAQTGSLEDRLRGELRATKTQLGSANAQLAPAQARADTAEKTLAALKAKCDARSGVAKVAGPSADERVRVAALKSELAAARAKTTAGESAQTAAQVQLQTQITQGRQALVAMRTERGQALSAAQAQTAVATQAGAQIEELRARNLRLVALAREILDRYRHVGVGTALAGREPFLGHARVAIENEAEALGDRVYENRSDARGTLKTPAVASPSAAAAPKP